MQHFQSTKEIIEFAIQEEEASAAFYRRLAENVNRAWMKQVFEDFAKEEDGHKNKLQRIQKGELPAPPTDKVLDLKIGDYLIHAEINPELDYQQALILAMKKEKVAFRMYSDLASASDNQEVKQLLLSLAHEEAKHKLRFEVEYDEFILKEN